MKHILAPILLLVFLFPALALGEEVTFDDLVNREGIYYKKSTDVLFTGKTTGQKQGTFKDGVLDGPWVRYYDNGRLRIKGEYKNGLRVGPWVECYDNGLLKEKGDYKNGLREGPWVTYYENGELVERFSGTYKNGVMVR